MMKLALIVSLFVYGAMTSTSNVPGSACGRPPGLAGGPNFAAMA
jgi:hypothetical protein